jgi:large subunit ribosomal protein L21
VVEHGRGKKVINFKYKAKVRYRRKRGHRQGFTTLSIREISANGVTATATTSVRRPTAAPADPAMDMSARPAGFAGRVEAEAPAEEPVAEAPEAEAPAPEETPAPRTRRRRASTTESTEESTE